MINIFEKFVGSINTSPIHYKTVYIVGHYLTCGLTTVDVSDSYGWHRFIESEKPNAEQIGILQSAYKRSLAEIDNDFSKLEMYTDHPDHEVRKLLVYNDVGLDKLCNDKSWRVRWTMVDLGKNLQTLRNDPEWTVRKKIAERGLFLDQYINDPHEYVRVEVARQGYGLPQLVVDEKRHVRSACAEVGYSLDTLMNDEDDSVRIQVACHKGYAPSMRFDSCEDVRLVALRTCSWMYKDMENDESEKVRNMAEGISNYLDEFCGNTDLD